MRRKSSRNTSSRAARSSACLLLGVEDGLKLIDAVPQAEALFVRADGTVVTSSGFPQK